MLADRARQIASVSGTTDPYFANVEMLLHCNGINGSTVFTDNASSPKALVGSGNAQISTAQSRFGGASLLLDASDDYLTMTPAISLASGDFTFEFEIFFTTSITSAPVLTRRAGGDGWWLGALYSSGNLLLVWQHWTTGGTYRTTQVDVPGYTVNTWIPVCFERIGTTISVYSSGILRSTYDPGDLPGSGASVCQIGQDTGATGATLNGYLDEIRLTRRTGGRYAGAYTPATAPFPNS